MRLGLRGSRAVIKIVPTLCVAMQFVTLRIG
ncbi:hypothetical protein HBB04_04795 [Pseudomonas coronafaciens]|nr:hypothetical protein HBB04_04795 [Pseudomonas coronafaciens]